MSDIATSNDTDRSAQFHPDRELDLSGFRAVLQESGYAEGRLTEMLAAHRGPAGVDLVTLRRRLEAPGVLNTLVRLLYIGDPVAEERAATALKPVSLDLLVQAGVLLRAGDGLRATAKLTPVRDLFVFGDFTREGEMEQLPSDHVLGVGAASVTLAALSVRRQVESVLDLGTGAGIQALLAARHAAQVLGTDTNRRALNFAAMNARLNGIENLQLREGKFFEPVMADRFDLVVANPPFVISPESRFAFRDAGLAGDAVSEQVVRGAATHLTDHGYAVMLINWHHQTEDDWEERPRHWVDHCGCDSWILRFTTKDSLTYAADWLSPTEAYDASRHAEHLEEWMRYYQQMGIQWISAGAVILRRRDTPRNWVRCDTVPGGNHVGDCGDQIERVFASEDLLQRLGNGHLLLDQRLVFHAAHCLENRAAVREGVWTVQSRTLQPARGLIFSGEVDVHVMQLLAGCDGNRPLRELVAKITEDLHEDFAAVAAPCLAVVKKLMRAGMLTPA